MVGCTADLLALIFASSSCWLVVLLEIFFFLVLKLDLLVDLHCQHSGSIFCGSVCCAKTVSHASPSCSVRVASEWAVRTAQMIFTQTCTTYRTSRTRHSQDRD